VTPSWSFIRQLFNTVGTYVCLLVLRFFYALGSTHVKEVSSWDPGD